jgi:hypothetical protein
MTMTRRIRISKQEDKEEFQKLHGIFYSDDYFKKIFNEEMENHAKKVLLSLGDI